MIFKKIEYLLALPLLICSCSFREELCDKCAKDCECQNQVYIYEFGNLFKVTIDNFYYFFEMRSIFCGAESEYNLYKVEISPILDSTHYNGVVFLKTIDAIDHDNDDIISVILDENGRGSTSTFLFDYKSSEAEFNGFKVVDARVVFF